MEIAVDPLKSSQNKTNLRDNNFSKSIKSKKKKIKKSESSKPSSS